MDYLQRWPAVQVVVLIGAKLIIAYVRLECLEVSLDLPVAYKTIARA